MMILLSLILRNSCFSQTNDVIWLKPTLFGWKYVKGDEVKNSGFLGKNLKKEVSQFNAPRIEMDRYGKLSAWSEGLSILWTCMAGLAVYEGVKERERETLYLSLSSSAIGLIIVILQTKSRQCLHKAVGLYNQEMLKSLADSLQKEK
ncbi:MAG: hypothetical protein AB1393_13360 [Candidatus Edwardsbacteria bacterium]